MEIVFYTVTRKVFENYVENKKLKEVVGDWFHSSNFIDQEGNVKARCSSSSWNPDETFEIADEAYLNSETLTIINNIINGK